MDVQYNLFSAPAAKQRLEIRATAEAILLQALRGRLQGMRELFVFGEPADERQNRRNIAYRAGPDLNCRACCLSLHRITWRKDELPISGDEVTKFPASEPVSLKDSHPSLSHC